MKLKETECPSCATVQEYDPVATRLSFCPLVRCTYCQHEFKPRPLPPAKKTNDSKKRSKVQERKAAKSYGGRVQPASGALAGAKGDFREKGVVRGECKLTRKESFSLKLKELLKVEKEATGVETPLFEVLFDGVYPKRRYVVLRAEDYIAMKNNIEHLMIEVNRGGRTR